MEKTIRVSEATHERLNGLKPYDSMSFDELIDEMADVYEDQVTASLAADGGADE